HRRVADRPPNPNATNAVIVRTPNNQFGRSYTQYIFMVQVSLRRFDRHRAAAEFEHPPTVARSAPRRTCAPGLRADSQLAVGRQLCHRLGHWLGAVAELSSREGAWTMRRYSCRSRRRRASRRMPGVFQGEDEGGTRGKGTLRTWTSSAHGIVRCFADLARTS